MECEENYVAGFAYCDEFSGGSHVLLIKKNRPDWQAGKLNGVGGHIEPGESPLQAMVREFREEAGVHVPSWRHFATVTDENRFRVEFFSTKLDFKTAYQTHATTDEELQWVRLRELGYSWSRPIIPNLSFLVPLGHYDHDIFAPARFVEQG